MPPGAARPSLWQRLWRPADPVMVDAGAGGELLVARVRLLLTGILLVIPATNVLLDPRIEENYVGLGVTLLALALALVLFHLVKRDVFRPWLPFLTSAMDVTLVSLALASFLVLGAPHTAVNSKVLFEVYFLAIFGTSLRYDARVCVLTGALAILEYGAIVAWAATHWRLNDPVFAPFPYGMFSWNAQGGRLVILAAAGVLSTTIVLRTQRLRHLSTSDRLTGLFNRGYFEARLAAELSRARRSGQPLSLVVVDVDHFKRFNDQHGHPAGDVALRTIGTLLRHAVRRSDIVARWGGEEFVLVFPETEAEATYEKLEQIRRAVAQAPIRLPRQQGTGTLTISAGIAAWPRDAAGIEELLAAADARLFAAKAAGRDRVVLGSVPAGTLLASS
ncbi:MAG TPA: GGDEF domain-containing protein [Gemmatimonadales bacterium]|nr:GGDEF domain-containing protein [Gemmatimonadales bacterium]